jgi:deoxyribonuclease V
MKARSLHPWDVLPREAVAIQERLRGRVVAADRLPRRIRRVAGVDAGFDPRLRVTRAAVAVFSFPSLELVDQGTARRATGFPYVPGLLSFREIPALLDALARLRQAPDLLVCDGHGLAHPRRCGLACHLGLVTDTPAIGVAKTLLVGKHAAVPAGRGAWRPLVEGQEVIGAALRTRPLVRPVYVSAGHRVSLETAIRLVLELTRGYRLPETTRLAHRLASEA